MEQPIYPCRCAVTMGADTLAEIVIGHDLHLVLAVHPACPDGNDAGEKFTDDAISAGAFDSDWNYLGALARFPDSPLGRETAHAALPALIELAREAWPDHAVLAGSHPVAVKQLRRRWADAP